MIDADELAEMKATQELTLTETVYIQTLTETSNNAGGQTHAWNTTITTVGRIAPTGKSAKSASLQPGWDLSRDIPSRAC